MTKQLLVISCLDIDQAFKFSYNFKAKRYNCEFDEQKSFRTQAFWGIYLWLNEEIEHDEKVTLQNYLNIGISDETQIAVVVCIVCPIEFRRWLIGTPLQAIKTGTVVSRHPPPPPPHRQSAWLEKCDKKGLLFTTTNMLAQYQQGGRGLFMTTEGLSAVKFPPPSLAYV